MTHTPALLQVEKGSYAISTDLDRLDFDVIHGFLSQSYWSPGIPRAVVEKAAHNSLCFGVYRGGVQVGFSRIISDYATFAYLADVFILPEHRGIGLSKWMMATVQSHPSLQAIRHWVLFTADAHGLYAQFGFVASPSSAERLMVWHDPAYAQRVAQAQAAQKAS